jgi:acylphosphatase
VGDVKLSACRVGPARLVSGAADLRCVDGMPVTSENASPTSAQPPDPDTVVRMTVWVHGRVQGVGFRWWTRARALELGLAGHAANLADGRVEIVAEGRRADCYALLTLLRSGRTPGSVQLVVERFDPPRGITSGFSEG